MTAQTKFVVFTIVALDATDRVEGQLAVPISSIVEITDINSERSRVLLQLGQDARAHAKLLTVSGSVQSLVNRVNALVTPD